MAYFEITRERIFPILVILSLILAAIAAFILFDSASGFTASSTALIDRTKADAYYWLLFKYPSGTASAYAEATSTAPAQSIPVLLYHGESAATGNTPLSTFVDQMRAMKENGWQTITLAQFQDYMKKGTPVPDKSFLLTFDDGRRDTFYPSDPVIKDMGFNAVMFVITGLSMPDQGNPQHFYLNENELQLMVQSGRWELQSHGKMDHLVYHVQSTTDLSQKAQTVDGHFMSNLFWNDAAGRFENNAEFTDRLTTDLVDAKQTLEKDFGHPIYAYAFPFNDFGQDSVNFPESQSLVAKIVPSIYTFAFYQHWPGNGDSFNYPDQTAFMIRRIEPNISWSGADLVAALNAGRAKPTTYLSTTFGTEWVGSWGIVKKGDSLALSTKETTGATAFLDGSGWWHDYSMTADVNWISGSSVELLARNTDDVNYLACSYTAGQVTIEKHVNDNQVDMVQASSPIGFGKMTVGMTVQGSVVQCLVNGTVAVSTTFTDLSIGGIGVEVWDATPGVASGVFSNISVKPL